MRPSTALAALTMVTTTAATPLALSHSPSPDIPDRAFVAYYNAAAAAPCHVDWRYIAAVGRTETGHGSSGGATIRSDGLVLKPDDSPILSSAGARGPTQFMPATWAVYGAGNIDNIDDASAATARLLCANGIETNPTDALGSYNGGASWRQYSESRAYVELTTSYAAELPEVPAGSSSGVALSAARQADSGSLGSRAAARFDVVLRSWEWLGAKVATTPGLNDAWTRLEQLRQRVVAAVPGASPTTAPPVLDAAGMVDVRGITVSPSLAPELTALMAEADRDGITLAGSGYRTHDQQLELRRQNCGDSRWAIYEADPTTCNPPTAKPGTSLHEQGLAVDFTDCDTGSPVRRWLERHAAAHGLHPNPVEPWHWSTDPNGA